MATNDETSPAEYVHSEDEFDALIASEDRLLVDFYADWCGPCTMMAPMVDELAGESDGSVVKVDVESLPHVASRYHVNSIPTFVAFADGEVTERFVGMQSKDVLANALE